MIEVTQMWAGVRKALLDPNDGQRHTWPGCANAGVGKQAVIGAAAGELKFQDVGVRRGNSGDKAFGKRHRQSGIGRAQD